MATIRLRYVKSYFSSNRVYYYFRRRDVSLPLPGVPGSTEFNERYAEALDAHGPSRVGANRNPHGSVSALIGLYGETAAFKAEAGLAPRTRQQRWTIISKFRNEYGTKPIARIERKHMAALLARLSPAAQLNWIKALRPMFEFAISIGWLKANPLVDVKVRYKGGELTPWTEVEIKQYRDHHPIGCMARLAIELLYGTVMRSSDVIALGPSNLWNGKLTRRTQKTGKVLTLPILPELQAALDAMAPTAPDSTWLRHQRGGPFKTRSWNVAFAKWVSEAGLPEQFRAHGLRKAGMTRLANFGATPHIIQAWSGHKTLALVAHYTKTADQARLAQEGANILTKAG